MKIDAPEKMLREAGFDDMMFMDHNDWIALVNAIEKRDKLITEQLTRNLNRGQIAMAVMNGMLANPECLTLLNKKVAPEQSAKFLAAAAVEQADALIEELNK